MALVTVKVAVEPVNLTADAPVKFVPVMVTAVAISPLAGVKLVMVGADGRTVKFDADVAVPLGLVTVILPVVAAEGSAAVICVALATVNVAAVPLKATAVAPEKFVPVIVIVVPTTALAGAKLVIVGEEDVTVKLPAELAVPALVVTEILPEVAPAGTEVVIWVALATVNVAVVPLNFSAVAPANAVPVTVTGVPTSPLAGVKPVTVGAVAGVGGGVVDMPPPPHAAKAATAKSTGTSFRLVMNVLPARSVNISVPFLGASCGRARNGGWCTSGPLSTGAGRWSLGC